MNKEKGRPTKLTKELQNKICRAIQQGNYIETASAYAGVHKSTIYDWLKRGNEETSGIYKDFSDAVEKALAVSEMRDLKIISDSAREGNWQASAWRLERRFPTRWGRKDKLTADVTTTERHEIEIEQKLISDPESMELLKALYRRERALND
jgi:transposase